MNSSPTAKVHTFVHTVTHYYMQYICTVNTEAEMPLKLVQLGFKLFCGGI